MATTPDQQPDKPNDPPTEGGEDESSHKMTSKQSIAELAYRLWNERGRPHGSEEEDWLEAERQLAANAAERWDAAAAQTPERGQSASSNPAG